MNIKHFNTCISIGLLILVFQSCKYKNPGFPKDALCWIPYYVGDKLHYSDGEEIIELEVIDFYATEPSHFYGLVMDIEWETDGYYVTNQFLNYSIKERYCYGCIKDRSKPGMQIRITQDDVFEFDIKKILADKYQTLITDSIEAYFFSDMTISNYQYQGVFKITKTKMKNNQTIEWIIKAKDKGIVQFYDRKKDKIWTLINE